MVDAPRVFSSGRDNTPNSLIVVRVSGESDLANLFDLSDFKRQMYPIEERETSQSDSDLLREFANSIEMVGNHV
jgi:hypothetical protein